MFLGIGNTFLRTATLQQNVVVSRFRLTVFTPFPSVVKKNQKKLSKNSWTAMTMLYLCTRKIEHAPACNRRSTSFESEGAVARCYSENEKEASTPAPPFKVTIRMRLSKEKTEGEWNGKWLTFVLWQTYIHQKGTLFVQYRNSSNSCWSMIILERNCPLP